MMNTNRLRPAGAILALVRKDLTDVRLLLAFVLVLDVAIVLIAHMVLAEELVALAVPSGRLAAAFGVLSMVPIVAEIYSVDERVGTVSVMRALPLGRWTRALAKVGSAMCAIVLAVAVVLTVQELLYAVGSAVDTSRLPRGYGSGGGALIHPGIANISAAVMVTAMASALVRNSLVAILAAPLALGIVVASEHGLARAGEDWIEFVLYRALGLAWHPLTLIAAVVFLMAITPLRGLAGRSLARRSLHALGLPILLASAAFAGVTLRELNRGPLEIGGPTSYLQGIEVSPDGSRVAMQLAHVRGGYVQGSIWIADTSTWEFVRAPEPPPSSRFGFPDRRWFRITSWTSDGRSLLVRRWGGRWPGSQYFAIDVDVGVVSPSSYEEAGRHERYQGVRTRRDRSTGHERHVELLDRSWRSIGDRMLQIPARANALVFYVDDDLVLHRLDRATGEDHVLPIEVERPSAFSVSPDGRYVSIGRLRGGEELFDLDTGRSRKLEGRLLCWTRRDAVCVVQTGGKDRECLLVTMEGDEPIDFGIEFMDLTDVDGRNWISKSWRTGHVRLHDASGAVVRRIFQHPGNR